MSLLSWDDIEDKPSSETLLARAKEGIKSLDTSEAEAELQKQQAAYESSARLAENGVDLVAVAVTPMFNPANGQTPEMLTANSKMLMERALKNVESMKANMDADGRVDVSDKFLLNCRADLNQLVPFKYDWSWLLYLDSCGNHWMPGELGLDRDGPVVQTSENPVLLNAVARFFIQYKNREHVLREGTLLACYRLITNPECRQYILRQSFESSMIHHAIDDVGEYFNVLNQYYNGQKVCQVMFDKDKFIYSDRIRHAKKLISSITDPTFETKGMVNTHQFLEELVYLYGYINWIAQITALYQLTKAVSICGKGDSLKMLCSRLIRDIRAQTMFGQHFINQALQENPGFTNATRVNEVFEELIQQELRFADTFVVDHNDKSELRAILTYFANDFITEAGLPSTLKVPQRTDAVNDFITSVTNGSTDTTQEASITKSGNGGSLDWN